MVVDSLQYQYMTLVFIAGMTLPLAMQYHLINITLAEMQYHDLQYALNIF